MPSSDHLLRALSLQEKLAFFYCAYVREEALDPETDADAARWWEAVAASSSSSARRKGRERVCVLLQQAENTSAASVERLDATYRAKRELLLLAEGTLRTVTLKKSASSQQKSLQQQRSRNGLGYAGDPEALERLEHARVNNELLMDCGALPVFSEHLQRSVHAFRGLNFQHLDLDRVDALIGDLQRDMVLMYLLLVFNAHQHKAVFDRQLMVLGICGPTYSLVTILDCLSQLNVLPGFPIKRLLLLFHEWLAATLGTFDALVAIKKTRRARHAPDPALLEDEAHGRLPCKTFKKTYHDAAVYDAQDPYYLQKLKFAKVREAIHMKYLHTPTYELKKASGGAAADRPRAMTYAGEDDPARATAPLDALDDEWELRCEQVYQLFLPCMRDYTTFLSNLVTLSCGSALNARDKKTFYSRRPSSGDQAGGGAMYSAGGGDYGMGFGGGGPDASNDNQFWKWILREKSIVLDVACQTILLIFKHFRASHACKAEYFMQFFLENNLLATLTKFMNKDVATYLQVSSARQDADADEPKAGFYALERELEKLHLRVEEDVHDYSLPATRTITSILRILQKLTKRKPNIIKNALCRGSSIVWLKRVVSLQIPLPRLYALKLVKSQAKYLGPQWMRKYTCIGLLTEIYLHVRPELDDDWLRYEDEDLNKPPSQDSVERLLFGEMQAYHHKYYFESALSHKPLPPGASLLCEARKELESDEFFVDGGRAAKLYSDLKLDPVGFCQQYDKWLDSEKLTLDADAAHAPLPISFS